MNLELTPDHRYILNGRHVPGCTEPLTGLGLIDSRWFTTYARERGRAIHAAIFYHLTGGVDWSTVAPEFVPYVDAALRFLDDAQAETMGVEQVVGSETYQFGGTLDWRGKVFGGDLAVVDWKSGFLGPVTGLQLSGYDIATGDDGKRRIGVKLLPDGTYRKRDFTERTDRGRFLAALDLYRTFNFKEGQLRDAV